MAGHIDKGRKGEELARQYLADRQYRILEQNWRSSHREIDIIAEHDGKLIIVEVKVRRSIGAERLEEHIPRAKQKRLIRAAGAYLKWKKLDKELRFDVILITGDPGHFEIEHIENAFSGWD